MSRHLVIVAAIAVGAACIAAVAVYEYAKAAITIHLDPAAGRPTP